jgi:hypothetical protein
MILSARSVSVAAMWAKWTVRPNDRFKRFAGGSFIGEAGILKVGAHGNLLWPPYYTATFVKVIIADAWASFCEPKEGSNVYLPDAARLLLSNKVL